MVIIERPVISLLALEYCSFESIKILVWFQLGDR